MVVNLFTACIQNAPFAMEVFHVVFVVFLVANAAGGWVHVDHRSTCTVDGFVGQHSAREVVSIPVHGRKPPHRFERNHLLHADLQVDGPRELTDVFHTTLLEELEDFPIPLVVLQRVNFVVLGLDEIREHSVGQRHGGDGHGTSPLRFDNVQTRLGENGGFVSVGVHV